MYKRFVSGLLCCAAAVALSGCITYQPVDSYGVCSGKTMSTLLESTDIKGLFQGIAAELCVDTCTDCVSRTADRFGVTACISSDDVVRQTVLVTDFVDIQTFVPNSQGLLMGEFMRGSLNNVCCYKIVQAEFAKYFKLSENGLVALSRQASEIKKSEYSQQEAIVGTYSFMNNSKIVIFVRRINLETGKIIKMVTRELDYSCCGASIRYLVK